VKPTPIKRELTIGSRTISIETGKLAKQADGSVIVRSGDTVVIVTACHAAAPREGIDFLPLTVDYREYAYASGRIPGGFFKRESKPAEKEVLTSRLIDRPIRPLFPAGWKYETQIIGFLLSADTDNDSDVLAITGASAALAISSIPFEKTIAGVRIGLIDGKFIVNPTYTERRASSLDLIVAGSKDAIVMVEAGAKEVTEEDMVTALDTAHAAIKQIVDMIDDLKKEVGKTKKAVAQDRRRSSRRSAKRRPTSRGRRCASKTSSRTTPRSTVIAATVELPGQNEQPQRKSGAQAAQREGCLPEILERGPPRRPPLRRDPSNWIEPVLLRTHGSAVFTRGETQALVTATLGTDDDAQKIETVEGETWRRFMLHYNFPPFSVGEVQFLRGAGRREIGHGALAERALLPMMPSEADFPYTVRVVSDILESNGSSSMASVCGGSLAMMDAGVPLKAPVAGVAMGLVMNETTGKYAVLTDIAGAEDHYGDMDFKVTGTRAGITALQMDIKVAGLTMDIMRTALAQAKKGRFEILDMMHASIAAPRGDISVHAPRIVTIRIPTEKIRDIIGPGGKMIRSIVERTGVKIDVEDDGRVNIASSDNEASAKAIAIIQELTATPEVDKVYLGRVERITDFGAFIEIMPGCDGLLHVSEMANYRVNDVRDELKEGEQIEVKVINIDPSGKVRLSRKPILKEGEGNAPRYSAEEKAAHKAAAPPDHSGGGFGGGRGGDRGGRPGGGGGRGGPRGPRR
jgi:polyribonucleotide nucleotidyltransferase